MNKKIIAKELLKIAKNLISVAREPNAGESALLAEMTDKTGMKCKMITGDWDTVSINFYSPKNILIQSLKLKPNPKTKVYEFIDHNGIKKLDFKITTKSKY